MEGWSGLMTGKPPQAPFVWPMPLPTPPQTLGPWFWPPGSAANSAPAVPPAPPILPPPVATPPALPKQTTITEADVGKVAFEMTYAPNPTPTLGGPPVVQTTRETTITAADVGKWAFEMPEPTPLPGAANPFPFPYPNMVNTLSAGKSDSRWCDSSRRSTTTKIFKDKSTQKYLVFDKHTQTDPKTQWKRY